MKLQKNQVKCAICRRFSYGQSKIFDDGNLGLIEMEDKNQKVTFIKRSTIIWIIILVAIDQAIKLFIAHFLMESQFTIIPHVFTFQTYHNINRGWIPNMLNFMMPLHIAVVINVVVILLMLVYYMRLHYIALFLRKIAQL